MYMLTCKGKILEKGTIYEYWKYSEIANRANKANKAYYALNKIILMKNEIEEKI